jgi:hypothetical protein
MRAVLESPTFKTPMMKSNSDSRLGVPFKEISSINIWKGAGKRMIYGISGCFSSGPFVFLPLAVNAAGYVVYKFIRWVSYQDISQRY